MKAPHRLCVVILIALSTAVFTQAVLAQDWQTQITIDWNKVVRVSQTTPTYQIVATKAQRSSSPIRQQIYDGMHGLGAEYVRFQAWYPWPTWR